MSRPLSNASPYRERFLGALQLAYQARLDAGFSTADLDGQPEAETLQCRDELDRTNWIGLLIKAQAMIALGGGALACDPPIRCTSNRMYAPAWTEVLTRLFVLLEQVGSAQANSWRLKDEIRAARDLEDLNRIDLEGGWP